MRREEGRVAKKREAKRIYKKKGGGGLEEFWRNGRARVGEYVKELP